jgi:hypothetical protein
MNTPDSRLSAAERAALANLEAAASAADPGLAAHLRGGVAWRFAPALGAARIWLGRAWAYALGARWWGIPLALVGLLLMALGLSVGLALSLLGAAMTTVGLWMLGVMLDQKVPARRPDRS